MMINALFLLEKYLQMFCAAFCMFATPFFLSIFNDAPAFLKFSMFYKIFFDKTARSFKNAPLFANFFLINRRKF